MDEFKKGDNLLGLYKIESNAIRGGSGLVYKVKHTGWNKEMAMKLPRAEEEFLETLRRECNLWASLGIHPNIAVCYYTRKIGDRLAVFSEWADEGTLGDMIKSGELYNGSADSKIMQIALESMRGLEYAHSRGLIHRDVKPMNILMSGGTARLNDFGLSELHAKGEEITQEFGEQTRAYASPEQLDGGNVTSKTDVYSWALTVMTMYIGETDRGTWGSNGGAAGRKAKELLNAAKLTVPDKMRELLLECLSEDPEKRPDDAEILKDLEKIYTEVCGKKPPAAYSEEVLECAAKTPGALNNRALIYVDIGEEDKAKECWKQAPNHPESVINLALLRGTYLPELRQNLIDINAKGSDIFNEVEAAMGSDLPVREYSVGEVINAKLNSNWELLVQVKKGENTKILSLDLAGGETSPVNADIKFPPMDNTFDSRLRNETPDGRGFRFRLYKNSTCLWKRQSNGKCVKVKDFMPDEVGFPVIILPKDHFISYSKNDKMLKIRELPNTKLNYLLSDTTGLINELDGIRNMLEKLKKAEQSAENGDFKTSAELIRELEKTPEHKYEWERFYRLKRVVGAEVGKSHFRTVPRLLDRHAESMHVVYSDEYDFFIIYADHKIKIYSCSGEHLAGFVFCDDIIKKAIRSLIDTDNTIIPKGFSEIKIWGKLCIIKVNFDEKISENEILVHEFPVTIVYDIEKGEFENILFSKDVLDDRNESDSKEPNPEVDNAELEILFNIGEWGHCKFNHDLSMYLEWAEEDGQPDQPEHISIYLNVLDFDIDDSEKGHVFAKLGRRPLPAIRVIKPDSPDEETARFGEDKKVDDNSIKIITDTAQKLNRLRDYLMSTVIGQNHAVETFIEGMFKALIQIDSDGDRKKPRAIFTFAGPPGVGKTMLAQKAAEALGYDFKVFDMTSYTGREANSTLIGDDAHYKNSSEGVLTGYVMSKHDKPTILLFDEIEKAHLKVLTQLYRMLDEGVLQDVFYDSFDEDDDVDRTESVKRKLARRFSINWKTVNVNHFADVSFKDTIIIFTSNAGRDIYENDSFISGAGVSAQEILHALKTEKDPETKQPFFPTALVSRVSTGYPIMFSNHTPFTLLKIIKNQFRKVCEGFRQKYGIEIAADENLLISMLLHEGGKGDARMITAKTEAFVYEELRKIAGSDNSALRKAKKINFEVELDNVSGEVNKLFNSTEKLRLLVCADKEFVENKALDNDKYEVSAADSVEEALAAAKKDVDIAIIEITPTDGSEHPVASPLEETAVYDTQLNDKTSYLSPSARLWGDARKLFKALRDEYPELPIYVLTNSKNDISKELVQRFEREGAQGSLTYGAGFEKEIGEKLKDISRAVHLQTSAHTVAKGNRILDFDTVFTNPKDGTINIKLRSFELVKAPITDEKDHPALKNAVKPDTRFDEVIGAGEAKKALMNYKKFFENPRKYCENGEKPPRGVLLYGPSGTGKTMLAKAMANECDVTFLPVAATELISGGGGSSAANVRSLFATARKYAPTIIFIDEVDAIAKKRDEAAGGNDEIINTLLAEMDGFKTNPKKPVLIIAATNLKEKLDDAFLRRFNTEICVDLPNQEERVDYVKQFLSGLGTELPENDIKEFAKRTRGLSPAKIKNVLENAWNARTSEGLTLNHLLDALEFAKNGELNEVADEETLLHTARHEVGHALIYHLCGYTPSYLTIESRGDFGGYMEHSEEELKKHHQTRKDILNRIRCSLGGRAAEMVYYGNEDGITVGACSDLKNATGIAIALINELGMDEEFGLAVIPVKPQEVSEDIRKRVNDILRGELQNAIDEIEKHREKFDKLVEALMEKRRLTADAIKKILK